MDVVQSRDVAQLPRSIALRILFFAYVLHDGDQSASLDEKSGKDPLRTVAPLVNKRWNQLLKTPEARRLLWARTGVYDKCFPRHGFSKSRWYEYWQPRAEHILELEIEIKDMMDTRRLQKITKVVTRLMASTVNLRCLRLTGRLPIAAALTPLDSTHLTRLTRLTSVYLAGGPYDGHSVESAVWAMKALPALRGLEIRFPSDSEASGFIGVLHAICELTRLHHLSLNWPLRSALPPTEDLPSRFSVLASLQTLQLKRVPLQSPSPAWLMAMPLLQQLFWDPFLPVDLSGSLPAQLRRFSGMRSLYAEMRPPLTLPPELTGLRRLALVGRGRSDHAADEDAPDLWDWLLPLTGLVALRLQDGAMKSLPEGVRRLTALTRLELMCNDISAEELLPGPWLNCLRHLHLGCNTIHRFPPALRAMRTSGTYLQQIFLANQRTGPGPSQGAVNVMQRLRLTGSDVAAILAAPALRTVVVNSNQPQVLLGGRTCDFNWLQRVLRHRGGAVLPRPIKLTSNELAYTLDPMEEFSVSHLSTEELGL